jgi:hypothetical protein
MGMKMIWLVGFCDEILEFYECENVITNKILLVEIFEVIKDKILCLSEFLVSEILDFLRLKFWSNKVEIL